MKVGEFKQQGDVIVRKIEKLPEGLTEMKGKVLQESEITGHHHHFMNTAAVDLYQQNEEAADQLSITPNFGKFIVVTEEAELFHGKGFDADPAPLGKGDHKSLKIPPGVYEIDIVREYDYDSNETVRVVD